MTIYKAMESGKPFKRSRWRKWRVIEKRGNKTVMRIFEYPAYVGYWTATINILDVLADDWETKE